MKGKRLLIVGAALALAVSGCASATRIARTNPLKEGNNLTFSLYSGTVVEGDYLIYYSGKAVNTTTSTNRLQYGSVSPANNVISTNDSSIVWHIAQSGNYWTLYNSAADKYMSSTGTKNQATTQASVDDKALWSITGSSTYEFVNKYNSANNVNANLRNNGTYGFACYATSTGGALSLYKLTQGVATVESVSLSGDMLTKNYSTVESWKNNGFSVSVTMDDGSAYSGDIEWSYNPTSPAAYLLSEGDEISNGSVLVEASVGGVGDSKTVSNINVSYATVEEGMDATPSSGTLSNVIVKGIVSQIDEVSTTYHNATYYISDDGSTNDQMKVFQGKYLNNTDFTNTNQLQVGDTVVIYGGLTLYSNAPQFAKNNYLLSLDRPVTLNPTITIDQINFTMNVVDSDATVTATSENMPAGGSIVWESAPTSVATIVNNDGVYKVHAVAAGVATITAKILDGNGVAVANNSISVTVVENLLSDGDVLKIKANYSDQSYYLTGVEGNLGTASTDKDNAMVFTAVAGNISGQFKLKSGDDYLSYSGSSNSVYTTTDGNASSALWTVVTNGTIDIVESANVGGRKLQFNYNSGNTRFACYTSNQTAVVIEKVVQTAEEKINEINTRSVLSYKYTKVDNTVTDVLNNEFVGISGTTYKDWSDKSDKSNAVYAGNSAGDKTSVQLRSNNNNSGIVSTTSDGRRLSKVVVVWNGGTASGRTLNVYGSNTAYESPADLYGDNAGTLLGTITCGTSTDLSITGDYAYIGLRSASGAMYLDSISISWGDPISFSYSNVAIRFGGFLSESLWYDLNDEAPILGYGVKLLAAPGEESPIDYYTELGNGKTEPSQANASQKAQQGVEDPDSTYFVWNLYVNVFDNLTYNYSAVAYIRTTDGDVYFAETTTSAAKLADQLIKSGACASDAFEGSLSNLANMK